MKRRVLTTIVMAFVAQSILGGATEGRACLGIPILEYSSVSTDGGALLICPAGDGATLEDIGGVISITVRSMCPEWTEPQSIPGIPATDIWLWSEDMVLCGGSRSSNADGPTDSSGQTTISGPVAAGGYAGSNVQVVVMGILIGEAPALAVVSPDMNNDLAVGLADLAAFASAYFGSYDARADMDGNGVLNSVDVALFARHWQHVCD